MSEERRENWQRKKAKKRKDHNHGKNGWVSGNPRYERKNADRKRSMKGLA
jgi:hypothetical protein